MKDTSKKAAKYSLITFFLFCIMYYMFAQTQGSYERDSLIDACWGGLFVAIGFGLVILASGFVWGYATGAHLNEDEAVTAGCVAITTIVAVTMLQLLSRMFGGYGAYASFQDALTGCLGFITGIAVLLGAIIVAFTFVRSKFKGGSAKKEEPKKDEPKKGGGDDKKKDDKGDAEKEKALAVGLAVLARDAARKAESDAIKKLKDLGYHDDKKGPGPKSEGGKKDGDGEPKEGGGGK